MKWLLPVIFLWATFALSDQAEIRIVLVADDDDVMAKAVVEKSAAVIPAGATVVFATASIKASMSDAEACAEIFKTKAPSVVIDTTRQLRETTSKSSSMVKKIIRQMGIPAVSTTAGSEVWAAPLTDAENVYLVSMPPPGFTMFEVLRALAIKQEMTNLKVLFDETFDSTQLSGALVENPPKAATLVHFEKAGADLEAVKHQVERIYYTDFQNIAIMTKLETLNTALLAVKDKNMLNKTQHRWFFISKDDGSELVCEDCFNATGLLITPVIMDAGAAATASAAGASPQKVDTAFYYDLTQTVLKAIAEAGDAWPATLTYPECGADMTDEMKAERAKATLATVLGSAKHVPGYGKFLVNANNKDNKQELKLELNLKFFNLTDKKSDNVGSWTATSGSREGKLEDKPGLATFKAKRLMRITTVEQHPFIYKKTLPNGEFIFSGYCIDLIKQIGLVMDFEYRIYENDKQEFGRMEELENHTLIWHGMIGDLVNDRADIALGPLTVMAERETVVDFTVPYYDLVGISIMMKKPDIKSSLFKFLTVLETNVWGCILGAYFFTSVLMYFFDRLSPYSFHNNREKLKDDPENRDFNLKECLWFCMTSLTPQGGGEAPRNLSGRLVAATWWLFGFIIIASYTANLAAFLTVSRLDSTIDSLDDLSRQYKIKYAPVENTEAQTYFRRMSHIEERFYEIWKNMSLDDTLNETERAKLAVWDYPVSDKYTKIWWTMTENNFPPTFQQAVDQVLASEGPQKGFALVGDSTMIKYAVMQHCKLVQVGSEFSRKPLALAVQQGSELKDKLSSAILKLLNDRKLEELKETWWTKNPHRVKCDDTSKQSDGISIANIGGVFIVIFIGVVLACFTLAIEYCYFKNKRSSTRVIAVKDMNSKDPLKR